MIDLYYWPTKNGKKVAILLEELGWDYNLLPCDIGRGDQFSPEFSHLSPNNRMPAIVDHVPVDGGGAVALFESGAIMLYLAEKAGRFWPQDLRGRYDVLQWVIWQMANQGPKTGELEHFTLFTAKQGDQSYALRRYRDEVHRLFGVLNNRLFDRRYVAGGDYTIADMICVPWVMNWRTYSLELNEFPYFKRWFEEVTSRPAVVKGLEIGAELVGDTKGLPREEIERRLALLFNQRARPAPAGGLL